ncbi:Ger(x)C family spore germination protein [Mesobacillus selenatarsenatis]|uniref:Spore germination protein xc. bacillus n=1 Tax=Mesobacillus selenatarsenatis (strain DSM 18680 / JCM 14380 / FERM P-15431 / SF-1) TaxID=1321606 RepID=A0A0A8X6M0_MESS1|nr:Ger(x)C family spore germination protein [Mesobacillus selenatarsenatis]GAM14692.1 spore germination protein xc. bacillus [Mesobacillus selenatarsenatis SF-1]
MKRKLMIAFSTIFLFFMTACENDIGEIENQNFATAIGVDYRDGKYHVYIQMLGLGSVAKSEGGAKAPPEIFVSETSGATFIDAFFKAYHTAQERILWAHVTAIVLSDAALEQGLDSVFDGLTRYYEFRPTPWIFGTKNSLDDILSTTGFFNQTSLNTILHSPKSSYEQSSTIKPVKLNQFAREFFDPGRTTYIPSLTIDDNQWKKNKKNEDKLAIDGAFFLDNQKYKGFFPFEEIKGIRWITPETVRASLLLPNDKNPEFLAVLEDQMVKVQPVKVDGNFGFTIHYLANGVVSNRMKNNTIEVEAMEEFVKKGIISEVKQLYQLGLEHDIDFLNLEHQLYRKHHADWKKLENQASLLQEDSIKSIEVSITLEHSGSFKNRKIKIKE